MIVAIDGPAGAGKSTVARAVADALGVGYVDTGAMYRALTLLALRSGVDLADDAVLADLARANPVRLDHGSSGLRVYIAGDDVTMAIREADVTGAVSQVAAHPGVRAEMVDRQRDIMAIGDWVSSPRRLTSAHAVATRSSWRAARRLTCGLSAMTWSDAITPTPHARQAHWLWPMAPSSSTPRAWALTRSYAELQAWHRRHGRE